MSIKDIKTLKAKFSNGNEPHGEDFSDVFDSYLHKYAKLPQEQIVGLRQSFGEKANLSDLSNIVGGMINKGIVATQSNLPTNTDTVKTGHAYIVINEVSPSGLSYIFQAEVSQNNNGESVVKWNNTMLTAFPADVLTVDNLDVHNLTSSYKVNYTDMFSFKNNLAESKITKNYATSSDGEILPSSGQAICQMPVSQGKTYLVSGFHPTYGFCIIFQDANGNKIDFKLDARVIKVDNVEYYLIDIPDNDQITQVVFTLYRQNNNPSPTQIPFNKNTAIITEYTHSIKLPLHKNISSDFAENIPEYTSVKSAITKNDYIYIAGQYKAGIYNSVGEHTPYEGYRIFDFPVSDTACKYRANSSFGGSGTNYIFFFDENHNLISSMVGVTGNPSLKDYEFRIPKHTAIVGLNGMTSSNIVLEKITEHYFDVGLLEAAIKGEKLIEVMSNFVTDGFIGQMGEINNGYPGVYKVRRYDVQEYQKLSVTSAFGGSGTSYVFFYKEDGSLIKQQYSVNGTPVLSDAMISIPGGCSNIRVNASANALVSVKQIEEELIQSQSLKKDIEELSRKIGRASFSMQIIKKDNLFYIRTSFDNSQDIVIHYGINTLNCNISPRGIYIGLNTEHTETIVAQAIIHSTYDSTAPFLLNNYWYLFGEHGYLIPVITSIGHDKTTVDIGSWWQTDGGKQFQLINIDGTSLSFAPKIVKDGAGAGADMSSYAYGGLLSNLSHVSGATNTQQITTDKSVGTQWRPITRDVKKQFFCDGVEITENGVYECNEFIAIDVHEGYNPITITQWQPEIIATPLCRFTFTHRFVGMSVFVSNLIEVLYPMWFNYYGGFQPMGLRKYGNFEPMIFIPKVKEAMALGKVTVDWKYPQNCAVANQNWVKTTFSNNDTDLTNVDDLPDRIVEFLQNPSTKEYSLGFAAGYSLISGAGMNSKRKNLTNMVFQFSQDERNKWYPRVFEYTKAGTSTILPAGYVNNINFYYSYFDPSANECKVYWYKEGSKYVVYIHSHKEYQTTVVNLPMIMEGLTAQIVESTSDSELLSDTVAGGKLIAKFPTGANYLVLTLEN